MEKGRRLSAGLFFCSEIRTRGFARAGLGSKLLSMQRNPYPVLAVSLLGISLAGPLVRLSSADPAVIAVWRLGFSLIIVAGFLLATGEWRDWARVRPREAMLAVS